MPVELIVILPIILIPFGLLLILGVGNTEATVFGFIFFFFSFFMLLWFGVSYYCYERKVESTEVVIVTILPNNIPVTMTTDGILWNLSNIEKGLSRKLVHEDRIRRTVYKKTYFGLNYNISDVFEIVETDPPEDRGLLPGHPST